MMKVHCEASILNNCGKKGVYTISKYGYYYLLCLMHYVKFRQQENQETKVWITGSRTINDEDAVFRTLDEVFPDGKLLKFRHGNAKGVDRLVTKWCKVRGYDMEDPILPNYRRYRKGAGKKRNGEGVEWADVIMAVWDGTSPGTADCIKKGRDAEKALEIYILHDCIKKA